MAVINSAPQCGRWSLRDSPIGTIDPLSLFPRLDREARFRLPVTVARRQATSLYGVAAGASTGAVGYFGICPLLTSGVGPVGVSGVGTGLRVNPVVFAAAPPFELYADEPVAVSGNTFV